MTPATDSDDDLTAALLRSRLLVDAPEPVIHRALQIFQARRPAATAPRLLRTLAARLQFDSAGLGAQVAGVRNMGEDTRQILFSAEGRDVDLRISPEGEGWLLSGQVLGPDATGRAQLAVGAYRGEVAWNELCEFSFQGVPEGEATLTLQGDDWEIVLPLMHLQAARRPR